MQPKKLREPNVASARRPTKQNLQKNGGKLRSLKKTQPTKKRRRIKSVKLEIVL